MDRRSLLTCATQAVLLHTAHPLWLVAQSATKQRIFSVREQGATGDGRKLDTEAIQKTIDRCTAHGGGIVNFPSGTYLSGSIFLRSRVLLRIEKGATILGSTDLADYRSRIDSSRGAESGTGGHLISAGGRRYRHYWRRHS